MRGYFTKEQLPDLSKQTENILIEYYQTKNKELISKLEKLLNRKNLEIEFLRSSRYFMNWRITPFIYCSVSERINSNTTYHVYSFTIKDSKIEAKKRIIEDYKIIKSIVKREKTKIDKAFSQYKKRNNIK